MYSSIVVGICVKLSEGLGKIYSYSYLHKILKKLNIFSVYYRQAKLKKILDNNKSIFADTLVYKIYREFFDALNIFCNFLKKILEEVNKNSLVIGPIKTVCTDFNSLMGFVFTFLLYCGLFTLIGSVIAGKSIKLTFLIFLISFIGSIFKGKYVDIIKNSIIVSYFADFFKLDKEVSKWW